MMVEFSDTACSGPYANRRRRTQRDCLGHGRWRKVSGDCWPGSQSAFSHGCQESEKVRINQNASPDLHMYLADFDDTMQIVSVAFVNAQ